MSEIVLPDPHPGRCRNHRNVYHGNGVTETLRCLDYESVEHVCSFPKAMGPYQSLGGAFHSYSSPPPAPWVKPSAAALNKEGRADG